MEYLYIQQKKKVTFNLSHCPLYFKKIVNNTMGVCLVGRAGFEPALTSAPGWHLNPSALSR